MRVAKSLGAMVLAMFAVSSVASAQATENGLPVEPPVVTTIGLDAQELSGGAIGGLSVLFEGSRWGLGLSLTGLHAGVDYELERTRALGLASADLSYALIASPNLRLKLELGLGSAHPSGATMFGARFGASGKMVLAGPLSLEAALRVTGAPYTFAEAFYGGALSFGAVAARVGRRVVFYEDLDALGAAGTRQEANGWYGGLAFSF
jgi:hypothetical protein